MAIAPAPPPHLSLPGAGLLGLSCSTAPPFSFCDDTLGVHRALTSVLMLFVDVAQQDLWSRFPLEFSLFDYIHPLTQGWVGGPHRCFASVNSAVNIQGELGSGLFSFILSAIWELALWPLK